MNISSLVYQQPGNRLLSSSDELASTTASGQIHSNSSNNPQQDATEVHQSALQLVNDTLTQAYNKLSSKKLSVSDKYQAFEPLTAEKVANNVLGFIERRLRLDQADGATQEQLASRLDAGLAGFKKGFADAQDKLKALDMLSPEVSADIGKTYDLVTQGIADMRQRWLGESGGQVVSATPAQSSPAPAGLAKAASDFESITQLGVARSRDFSFELTTREGDKVSIKASAAQGLGLAYGQGANQSTSIAGSYSASQSFSLDIQGDLNADELSAINDLLGKVNDLADQFYAGNLEQAWSQAADLGLDTSQISGYKLNLAQVDVQAIKAQQGGSTPNTAAASTQSPPGLSNGAQAFMSALLDALDLASNFAQPKQLVTDLAQNIDQFRAAQQQDSGREASDRHHPGHHGFLGFIQMRMDDLTAANAAGQAGVTEADA